MLTVGLCDEYLLASQFDKLSPDDPRAILALQCIFKCFELKCQRIRLSCKVELCDGHNASVFIFWVISHCDNNTGDAGERNRPLSSIKCVILRTFCEMS